MKKKSNSNNLALNKIRISNFGMKTVKGGNPGGGSGQGNSCPCPPTTITAADEIGTG